MPVAFVPYGSWDFIKPPQYVEETSYGVTPASPVFKLIGSLQGLSPDIGIQKEVVRSIGNRDPVTQAKLMDVFTGAIKYRPFDINFMSYGVNLPNVSAPAGTNAASLTIAFSIRVNGTEQFFAFRGVKTDKISIEVSKDGGVVVGQDLKWSKSDLYLTDLTSIGVTTPTYITTTPNTAPWTSLTGGVDPFTLNSIVYPVDRLKCDVNQNIQMISPNGSTGVDYLAAGNRETSLDFDTWDYNNVLATTLQNLTLYNSVYTLNNATTPNKLTFTGVGLDSRGWSFDANNNGFQRQSVKATVDSVVLS